VFIVGAGTLGEIVLETAIRAGHEVKGFYDDITKASELDGLPILGRLDDLKNDSSARDEGVFVAIGDNRNRQRCAEELRALGVHFPNIIDPRAILSPTAILGVGNLLLPGCYVGTKCTLGSCNLLFPGVSITHHNNVGNYCFFSPNASVGGFSRIGDCCKVGMNCVVLPYRELEPGMEFAPSAVIEGIQSSLANKA